MNAFSMQPPAAQYRAKRRGEARTRRDSDPAPVLLVASAGGHLEELLRLRRRMVGAGQAIEWVTPATEQSNTLLRGQIVHTVPYIGPRDAKMTLRLFDYANQLMGQRSYSEVISTGAAIAVPYLAAARIRGIRAHYIESAARSLKPSLTGQLAARIPGVNLYTQYDSWDRRRWDFQGSVFDGFTVVDSAYSKDPVDCRRVVVTLGTMQGYGFRRAVLAIQRVLDELPVAPESILWQTGCTDVEDLGVEGRNLVDADELSLAMSQADVVIAHAGVGSALTALTLGKCPVLIPRLGSRGEHVDDHQLMIARFLQRRALAAVALPEELGVKHLQSVLRRRAVELEQPGSFVLAR